MWHAVKSCNFVVPGIIQTFLSPIVVTCVLHFFTHCDVVYLSVCQERCLIHTWKLQWNELQSNEMKHSFGGKKCNKLKCDLITLWLYKIEPVFYPFQFHYPQTLFRWSFLLEFCNSGPTLLRIKFVACSVNWVSRP